MAPRYVIQEHYARSHHFDLRLERDGVLLSWAVPKGMPTGSEKDRLAIRVEDHALSHLDHEDHTPVGDEGAVKVKIWDGGTYEPESFSSDEIVFTLRRAPRREVRPLPHPRRQLAHTPHGTPVAGVRDNFRSHLRLEYTGCFGGLYFFAKDGGMEQSEADLKALENFIVGNAELEKLEAMLDRFNIFEAVGMERQEIRHSKFLSFLLDPKESHGMGDVFVKRLLQRAIMASPDVSASVTPIELSLWDLGEMTVRREWRRIDIFLLDEREKLAVVIENKIDSGEHGDQLNRYHAAVKKEFPEHKLIALYLTPGGDEPSHPEYFPLDYRAVCGILDELAESRASIVEPDAKVLIKHYTEMLRRHIVGDSEIARLSRQIYHKHSRAIDLIYGHRPDPAQENRELLERLINDTPQLPYRGTHRNLYIFFYPDEWNIPSLNANSSDPIGFLRFVFHNHADRLTLFFETSPGDQEIRQKLYEMCLKHESLFENPQNPEDGKYPKFYSRTFLTPEFCETATDTEREAEIRENWDDFLENDFPRIDAVLKQEAWIWEPEESEAPPDRSDRFTMKRPSEDTE